MNNNTRKLFIFVEVKDIFFNVIRLKKLYYSTKVMTIFLLIRIHFF